MPPKLKKSTPHHRKIPKRRALDCAIVLVDGTEIRHAALAAYRMFERDLRKVRREQEAFQSTDLAAFARWEAATFGPLLTKLREISAEVHEKNDLLDDIEEEIFFTGCSRKTAYARVKHRRENPTAESEDRQQEASASKEEFSEEAFDDEFEEEGFWPEMDFNIDEYEQASDRIKETWRMAYEHEAELYERITGERVPTFSEVVKRARMQAGGRRPSALPTDETPESPAQRFKSLYRKLVRLLHPDGNANHGAAELDLWHALQEAYQSGDLERLQTVATRYDLSLGAASDSLPVASILAAGQEIAHALRILRRDNQGMQSHPAWKFTKRKNPSLKKLEAQRRDQLKDALRAAEWELRQIQIRLEKYAENLSKKSKAKPANKRDPQKPAGEPYMQPGFNW